jgi:hypothetical protein
MSRVWVLEYKRLRCYRLLDYGNKLNIKHIIIILINNNYKNTNSPILHDYLSQFESICYFLANYYMGFSNYEIEAFKPLFTKLSGFVYSKPTHHKIFD